MAIKLDKYEQEIEDNFQGQKSVINTTQLELLKSASVTHLKNKKSITIRVTNHDLEAIKIKASKMGLAYQTYINMLIHQAASKI
jgi:predicted DNA binding CopG/RHH family protein